MTAPNWYDVLDVDSTATTDEIRVAWRDAIAELTPADRRFRLYNQAAEVLLDPERRAAHDAALAEEAGSEQEPEAPPASPVTSEEPVTSVAPDAPEVEQERVGEARGPQVPTWLIAGLAVLTALSVGLMAYLLTQPSSDAVEEATGSARAAAERAIGPVLSYDYRDLEASRESALNVITSDFRDEYDKFFDGVVVPNAETTKTVVTAEVIASAVVRGGEERVEIMLFVNRPTTNAETKEPEIYKDQVTVFMEKVEDEWLIDCVITTPEGTCGS